MDLLFVIDQSRLTNQETLDNIKAFIKKNLPAFELGRDDTRIGIVRFDSKVELVMPFSEGIDREAVLFALRGNDKY